MLALVGAAPKPRVSLMTALPLVWGEGDASDVLAGQTRRSETLAALDKGFVIRPIDTITPEALGHDTAMIAQPRRLTPTELVTFDAWIRQGGRALVFADPELVWPSRYPPGDPRRPPPVTLLDPLFAHWGVVLNDSDKSERIARIGDLTVTTATAGRWHGPKSCMSPDPLVLDCRIGRGRVILVADADLLDPRLWQNAGVDNPEWVARQLRSLAGQPTVESNHDRLALLLGAILTGAALWLTISRYYRRT